MTHDAPAAFDAHASGYDALRRQLIPPYDRFYGTAVHALSLAQTQPPRRVLDLGAGTGLLSAQVVAAHPGTELHLLDAAPAMLERARATLGEGATMHVADLATDPLPPGSFDAVVSSLAIHHLTDADKRALFHRVHDVLEPGGVFVNAEQVAGATAVIDAHFRAWHAAAQTASADDWAAALQRMSFDRCAPVQAQLRWLTDAGFTDVDCHFQDHCFAVLVGRRAALS